MAVIAIGDGSARPIVDGDRGTETPLHAVELPVSEDQQRFWHLQQLKGRHPAALNIGAAVKLTGALSMELLPAALAKVVSRHPYLRAAFREDAGTLRALPAASALPIEILDSGGAARSATVQEHLHQLTLAPFDLTVAPLWRLRVARLGPNEHLCVVVMHHSISDYHSFAVLFAELAAEHGALRAGRSRPSAEQTDAAPFAKLVARHREALRPAQLAFWRSVVAGTRPIVFPEAPGRGCDSGESAEARFLPISDELARGLAALGRQHRVRLSSLFLAAFEVALQRATGAEDFLVGMPVDGRIAVGLPAAIGCYSVPAVVRAKLSPAESLVEVAARADARVLEVLRHPPTPFAAVADIIRQEQGRASPRPVQALFNYVAPARRNPELLVTRLDVTPPLTEFDVALTLHRAADGLTAELVFDRAAIDDRTRTSIAEHLATVFGEMIGEPAAAVALLSAPPVAQPAAESSTSALAIAATFVAEPLRELIARWGQIIETPLVARLCSYDQVMQQLLDPASTLAQPDNALNVVLIRFVDLFRNRPSAASESDYRLWIERFVGAVEASVKRHGTPHLVGLCPAAGEDSIPAVEELRRALRESLGRVAGVFVVDEEDWRRNYPTAAIFDPVSDRAAHIPFTPEYFAVLATVLVRHGYRRARGPVKAIVVDCDNTLWQGVLGEDGVAGVRLTPQHLALHRFLLDQSAAGVLVCLCSKNDPALVHRFFAERKDSLLRPEHVVAQRINWSPKSQNLVEIADELGLGLDSFAFLDDSPLEVEEVRRHCPEVLALQVPAPAALESFLRHLWALDILGVTSEDRRRTQLYREAAGRRELREQAGDLLGFLRELQLQVRVAPLGPETLARSAQLTLRTNQFNTTTLRRSEAELAALSTQPGVDLWTVQVEDKFGDYGQCGLVIARSAERQLWVDALMLSCRVLGRGVEHRVIALLGETARTRGLMGVRLRACPTARNAPACDFLRRIGGREEGGEIVAQLSAAEAAAVSVERFGASAAPGGEKRARPVGVDRRSESKRLARVATELDSLPRIMGALAPAAARATLEVDGSSLLESARRIGAALLGRAEIGPDDDFFKLGGTSLLAVRFLSELHKKTGLELGIDDFYLDPTPSAIVRRARSAAPQRQESSVLAHLLADVEDAVAGISFPDRAFRVWELREPTAVLLTGATGFLGPHLLLELLRQTNATVHLLLRAGDETVGWQRLRSAFARTRLSWSDEIARRCRIHPGDLARARLGLETEAYAELCETVTSIYHGGAAVDFLAPYEALKAVNVGATAELLQLACAGPTKPLHYVSTLGVQHSAYYARHRELDESVALGSGALLPTGYQRSKWVSERILCRAAERGLPTAIYRPGTISGDSNSGAGNPRDFFSCVFDAAFRLRLIPNVARVDMAPVDFVARAVVALSLRPSCVGRVYHLAHPEPLSARQLQRLYDLAGFGIRVAGLDTWVEAATELVAARPDHPLAVFAPVFSEPDPDRNLLKLLARMPPASTRNVAADLGGTTVRCPPIDATLLSRYYDYQRETGALQAPHAEEAEQRYLWFTERMEGYCVRSDLLPSTGDRFALAHERGRETGEELRLHLTIHAESLYALVKSRSLNVEGQVSCPALQVEPLEVAAGTMTLRPLRGVPPPFERDPVFIEYLLHLCGAEGRYLLRGSKRIRDSFHPWRDTTTLDVQIVEEDGQGEAVLTGRVAIPPETYVEDQLKGLHVHPSVPEHQAARAKAVWLALLAANIGESYVDVGVRKLMDLFSHR